mgnify:CR=1 FL=1
MGRSEGTHERPREVNRAFDDRQAKIDSIFRAAPVGIGMVVNRVLAEVNDRICEMTGYSREDLVGKSARILYPTQEDYEFVGRVKYGQIAEKGIGAVETRMRRKDGTVFDVLLSSAPIDPSDLSQGVTFTMLDITERKRAEEERRALEDHKREFYRQTILSVTEGKLDICDAAQVNQQLARATSWWEISRPSDVSEARHAVESICREAGFGEESAAMFVIAVGEAITNALKHASKGRVYAGVEGDEVWVGTEDHGPGMESLVLPGAVLRRGFSTKPSLGLGFSIMLDVADHVLLKTGPEGTTVVLFKGAEEKTRDLDSIPDTWSAVADLS